MQQVLQILQNISQSLSADPQNTAYALQLLSGIVVTLITVLGLQSGASVIVIAVLVVHNLRSNKTFTGTLTTLYRQAPAQVQTDIKGAGQLAGELSGLAADVENAAATPNAGTTKTTEATVKTTQTAAPPVEQKSDTAAAADPTGNTGSAAADPALIKIVPTQVAYNGKIYVLQPGEAEPASA